MEGTCIELERRPPRCHNPDKGAGLEMVVSETAVVAVPRDAGAGPRKVDMAVQYTGSGVVN